MADRKYLQKRGNCWYIRVPMPPRLWGANGEFVCSLRTGDLRIAQTLRDKYLIPLLAETSAAGMVSAVARLMIAADEAVARQLGELRGSLSGLIAERKTLRELGESFLAYLESSRSYAPASLRKYRAELDAVCRLMGDDADPEAVTKGDVAGLRDTLLTLPTTWQRRPDPPTPAAPGETLLSGRSVGRMLMFLRRVFRWAIDEGQLGRRDNPADGIGVARVAPKHKRAPEPDEADALMDLPEPRVIDALTWRMMPLLARYTGCRAGELAQLRAEDVVVKQGIRCLRITGHGDGRRLKTASSERLVPVAERLAPHLDELLSMRGKVHLIRAGDYEAEDGTMKRAHAFLKHYNRRAKKVADDLSFHCWRVYANDAMATAGVDMGDRERILGHKSTRTQAAYTPENLRRLKVAVDTIP